MVVYSKVASLVLSAPSEVEVEICFIKKLTFGENYLRV